MYIQVFNFVYIGVKDNAKRKRRCRECSGCKADNCRTCRDMKLYGGPGHKKQCCIKRQCFLKEVNSLFKMMVSLHNIYY